jgi:hypothetical protein
MDSNYEKQMQNLIQSEAETDELDRIEHTAELDELLREAEKQSDFIVAR